MSPHLSALLAALALHQQPPPPAPPAITASVVVTATLAPAAEAATGRSVTVVGQEELARVGVTSAVDALRLLPGVDVGARGPLQVQADIALRGATFGQSLILIDGQRLNDSQSGHHNGELPVPVAGIDRIELVTGASSSVHGADALGGAINVITRRDRHAEMALSAGQFGLAAASGSAGTGPGPHAVTVNGWSQRSSGFTADRDFLMGGGMARLQAAPELAITLTHQRREFGAANFYGASPSKEWTDLTMAGAAWQRTTGAWHIDADGLWKNHGDHFRWDINRPGYAENRHRTNSADVTLTATRDLASTGVGAGSAPVRVSFGGSAGRDQVTSSNLGDHAYTRGGIFAELQTGVGTRGAATLGVRADRYSTFGSNVSPSVAATAALSSRWSVRGSFAKAFRVPTYTELYYTDPANIGTPTLEAEHGWTLDGAVEFRDRGWHASLTPFARWDANVIDWVRATPADVWRSANVRDVTTRGVEAAVDRQAAGRFVRIAYTRLSVDAPVLPLLSKYVLEYAKDSLAISGALPLGTFGLSVGGSADLRNRLDGQRYTLVGVRVSQTWRRWSAYVDGSNLLNETYQEVAGVAMPGRWMSVGVAIR